MATLQKIRNNAGLFVSIFIGFALLAFILGDLLRSGDSMMNKSRQQVAEIDGESVSIQLFQGMIDENTESYKQNAGTASLDEATVDQIQDQTWQQLVREHIMGAEIETLGIGVTGPELFDMVQGNNINPQIMQIPAFQNPQTGMFDRKLVVQFLKNLEYDPTGSQQAVWNSVESYLIEETTNAKYNTLIAKGMYVTTLQAKQEAVAKNKKVDFDYIKLPLSTISDSLVQVSDKDIEAYYNAHTDEFEQEEVCEINYVVFPIEASDEDITATQEWLADLAEDFKAVENNEQFVNLNSDLKFNGRYFAQSELSDSIQDLYNAEIGTVYGPYRDGESFKLSKVADVKNIPDSVRARHILIRPTTSMVEATAKADSILEVIQKGGSFAALAEQYSADGSAADGGDLGWFTEGTMVPAFNEACFFGKKGDLVVVQTQFGAHVLEVTGMAKSSKKVQIATIERIIEPSTETYQSIYAVASKFGGTNRTLSAFKEAAQAENLGLRFASVKRNDKMVANLESSRQVVRWAYEAEEKSVSEIFELGDNYVIAALSKSLEEGVSPLASVRPIVERRVISEKKADMLVEKLSAAKANTLQKVATEVGASVRDAKGVSLSAYAIPGLGFEPALQGFVCNAPSGEVAGPVKGESGVYLVQVTNAVEPTEGVMNLTAEKAMLKRSVQGRAAYQAYTALEEAKNVQDYRSKFY